MARRPREKRGRRGEERRKGERQSGVRERAGGGRINVKSNKEMWEEKVNT